MTVVLLLVLVYQVNETVEIQALEQRMVELVNVEREARGISPLEPNGQLSTLARSYSRRMAATGKVNHRLDRPLEERIQEVMPDTCRFGENVSKHTSIDYSLGDLMTSEGHRKNLLDPRYTTIGIGITRGEDGFLYITQEFARRCEKRGKR